MKINSIKYLSEEEIKSMKSAPMEVTKQEIISKDGIRRDAYSAIIHLSKLACYRVPITENDFALLHYASGNIKYRKQFNVDAFLRFVKTQFPKKDGHEAFDTYMIQIYVNKQLKWEFDLQKSGFLSVYLKGLEDKTLKDFEPLVRIAGEKEKAKKQSEDKKDDLPF